MGDFLIIPCLNCIKISQTQAWRPLIYFAWMKSMYFREYVCRFSRKSHYFCILGVSHLKSRDVNGSCTWMVDFQWSDPEINYFQWSNNSLFNHDYPRQLWKYITTKIYQYCFILNRSVSSVLRCPSGPRLNIKTVLSTYGDFHVKDKTAVRTSYL